MKENKDKNKVKFNNFILDNVKLANSIVFKHDTIARFINLQLFRNYGNDSTIFDVSNRRTWKYYQNLAGIYHPIDDLITNKKGIEIQTLENGEVIKLEKETIDNYPLTKQELLKFDKYYNKIVEQYPLQNYLIRGILLGLDINKIIESPDCTILHYNKSLVEENEVNLLTEIFTFLRKTFDRWLLKDYLLIDDNYLASYLEQLYGSLFTTLLEKRFDNINTLEVHSYFLNQFFQQFSTISKSVEVLSLKTKLWLYLNYRRLLNNVGKIGVVDEISKKVFLEEGIDLSRIYIKNKINRDKKIEKFLEINSINREVPPTPMNLEYLIELQEKTIENNSFNYNEIDIGYNLETNLNEEFTKLYYLSNLLYTKDNKINRTFLLLDLLVYQSFYLNVNFPIKFNFGDNNTFYNLNLKQFTILLLTITYKILDRKLHNTYTTVMVNDDVLTEFNNLLPNYKKDNKELLENLAVLNTFKTRIKETFTQYDFEQLYYNLRFSLGSVDNYIDNISNNVLAEDLKIISKEMFYKEKTIEINPDNLDLKNLLKSYDINFDLENANLKTLNEIIFNVFKIKNNDFDYHNKRLQLLKQLLNDLTPYTTQVITENITTYESIDYRHSGLIYGLNASRIKSGHKQCLHVPKVLPIESKNIVFIIRQLDHIILNNEINVETPMSLNIYQNTASILPYLTAENQPALKLKNTLKTTIDVKNENKTTVIEEPLARVKYTDNKLLTSTDIHIGNAIGQPYFENIKITVDS